MASIPPQIIPHTLRNPYRNFHYRYLELICSGSGSALSGEDPAFVGWPDALPPRPPGASPDSKFGGGAGRATSRRAQ